MIWIRFGLLTLFLLAASKPARAQKPAGRFEIFETTFSTSGDYRNPYVEVRAEATLNRPGGGTWKIPLFWDGEKSWKLRVSPDAVGRWTFAVASNDAGLDGHKGGFECLQSRREGGLRASTKWPGHFERQDGRLVWFLGDTAWGYFSDSPENNHRRPQAEHYARARASQGFNVIHSMLLSEAGDSNRGGPPFDDIAAERINPGYWREVDERLAFANRQGLTVGLALAWGDKRKQEPYSWRRFPSLEARKRYARYVAARYSAFDVYFLISGEWHAEVRTRGKATEDGVFREFVEIGDALEAADPHGRMIGIHPMSRHGSVREFAAAQWMSFGDYQQNYGDLHASVLLSRYMRGPVVNSEYGYYLRDQDGDGVPDKPNSYSAEDMRFASWDIAMAGGYLVTGFGTTYFAGHRDPGPFDPDAPKNKEWEAQIGHLKRFFERLQWWRLIPADHLLSSEAPRGRDRRETPAGGKTVEHRPPAATYWAMAVPGETYVIYVRGMTAPVELTLGARPRRFTVRQFNPRTGEFAGLGESLVPGGYRYQPPDGRDWAVVLEAAGRIP